MLRVSVVVPTFNATRTLPSCLAAIERLDPKPLEIILVDNGSTDGTLALLREFARDYRHFDVKVLQEPRRGAAAARNAGIRAAKGDLIAFIDSDCAPEPAWLSYLAEPFKDPRVGAVAGRVVAAPAASTLELFSALYTLQLPARPARSRGWNPWEGGFPTANLTVRRDLLSQLNGFDEDVGTYGEDYDLCARLYARGALIAYTPEAMVFHHHRTTLSGMLRQAFGFGRSHPYLLRRHGSDILWLDLPWRSVFISRFPWPLWVDLASADKKALGILAIASMYPPALLLLPLYFLWLVIATGRRARPAGTQVSAPAAVELAGLLLLKSFAMTVGRWWGSVKYGALCL